MTCIKKCVPNEFVDTTPTRRASRNFIGLFLVLRQKHVQVVTSPFADDLGTVEVQRRDFFATNTHANGDGDGGRSATFYLSSCTPEFVVIS